jgi:hypothetical protein
VCFLGGKSAGCLGHRGWRPSSNLGSL